MSEEKEIVILNEKANNKIEKRNAISRTSSREKDNKLMSKLR